MQRTSNRRRFLSTTGKAAAGLLLLPSARTAFGYRANERLNPAVVGMAGYGAYHGFAAGIHSFDDVGYTVSCDVDRRKIQRVYDLWKQRAAEWPQSDKPHERQAAADHYAPLAAKHPPLYPDFRRMLDEAGSQRKPIRVESEASSVNHLSYPRWERIRWHVPMRGSMPPVTFTWHHGHKPDYAPGSRNMLGELLLDHGAAKEDLETLLPDAGCLIVGSKGLLATTSHNTKFLLLPKKRFDHVEQQRPQSLPLSPGHYHEWIEACRGGTEPISNFEYAAPFAEFLTVGSLSARFPGEAIDFDPATGEITNHPRAAEFLQYDYRDGWTI